jgi:hypothetical protein
MNLDGDDAGLSPRRRDQCGRRGGAGGRSSAGQLLASDFQHATSFVGLERPQK